MSATVTVDDVRLRAALNQLAGFGLEMGRVLRVEGRRLLKEIVTLTPPNGGVSRVSASSTIDVNARTQGELAVGRDLANIFDVLSDATYDYVRTHNKAQFPRAESIWMSGSNKRVIDIDHFGTSLEEMRAFHKRKRSQATGRTPLLRRHRDDGLGRWKAYERMVVSRTMFEKYKREVQKQVGKMKGGWGVAAGALGVNLPRWISKHAGSATGGALLNLGRGDGPYFTATNRTNGSATKTRSLVQWAIRNRVKSIEANVRRMLKHGPGKSGDYGYAN